MNGLLLSLQILEILLNRSVNPDAVNRYKQVSGRSPTDHFNVMFKCE